MRKCANVFFKLFFSVLVLVLSLFLICSFFLTISYSCVDVVLNVLHYLS